MGVVPHKFELGFNNGFVRQEFSLDRLVVADADQKALSNAEHHLGTGSSRVGVADRCLSSRDAEEVPMALLDRDIASNEPDSSIEGRYTFPFHRALLYRLPSVGRHRVHR